MIFPEWETEGTGNFTIMIPLFIKTGFHFAFAFLANRMRKIGSGLPMKVAFDMMPITGFISNTVAPCADGKNSLSKTEQAAHVAEFVYYVSIKWCREDFLHDNFIVYQMFVCGGCSPIFFKCSDSRARSNSVVPARLIESVRHGKTLFSDDTFIG